MNDLIRKTLIGAAATAAMLCGGDARGDSVAQIGTAKRISRQTVTLIDPQGRPLDAGGGSGSLVKVGDILTFVVQFTPVPNGAYRGLGGYITDYIPPNTEVVGARIVDRNGNTVAPHRGGLACDGYGPRGSGNYTDPRVNGSMSQLYADTGIFYSTDARTARISKNAGGTDEPFLSLKNGLQMPVPGSGIGNVATLLDTSAPYFAHNAWDLAQVSRWAVDLTGVSRNQGNTPEHVGNAKIGYGSPVAGPESWYGLEATVDPPGTAITSSNINTNVKLMAGTGPWKRVRQLGSEIGRRGQGDDPPTLAQNTAYQQCPGNAPTRVGVPTTAGWQLSTSNPLPAGTNAVRFALGELVVGDEYYAEISLRVKGLPLHPGFGNINCAEVAGGDASSRSQTGGTGGKDHIWRYFLPAPACVSLDLLFENTVDKVLAPSNAAVTNTLEVKNLKTTTETNVLVIDCFDSGAETLSAAATTPGYATVAKGGTNNKCPNPSTQTQISWNVGSLAPGESKTFLAGFTVKGNVANQAVYLSDQLPAPGFVATSWTTVGTLAIMRLGLTATPDSVSTLPGVVHYTATVRNAGTGAAATIEYDVTLPAGWTYKAGTAKVDGAASANPTQTGAVVKFVQPASIAIGTTHTLEMDVDVPNGTAPGLYTADLTSWVGSAGQDFEDSVFRQAPVAVLTPRSDVPTVTSPILAGASAVSGKSTEAVGSTVTVYVNGNPLGTGTVGTGGNFTVAVPALYAGQRVEVTVTATGELESKRSAVESVVGGSTVGPDAGPPPACMDGIDNDGDGNTDFPADPGCCSFLDDSESKDGGACPALPKCSDGVDNDGDGLVDFPFDPGCASASDDDETEAPIADAGANDGSGGPLPTDGGGSNNPSATPTGPIPDRGGLDDDGSSDSGGCGCTSVPAAGSALQAIVASALFATLFLRRRRR